MGTPGLEEPYPYSSGYDPPYSDYPGNRDTIPQAFDQHPGWLYPSPDLMFNHPYEYGNYHIPHMPAYHLTYPQYNYFPPPSSENRVRSTDITTDTDMKTYFDISNNIYSTQTIQSPFRYGAGCSNSSNSGTYPESLSEASSFNSRSDDEKKYNFLDSNYSWKPPLVPIAQSTLNEASPPSLFSPMNPIREFFKQENSPVFSAPIQLSESIKQETSSHDR